jgi:hypothetical protein
MEARYHAAGRSEVHEAPGDDLFLDHVVDEATDAGHRWRRMSSSAPVSRPDAISASMPPKDGSIVGLFIKAQKTFSASTVTAGASGAAPSRSGGRRSSRPPVP